MSCSIEDSTGLVLREAKKVASPGVRIFDEDVMTPHQFFYEVESCGC